ncbi:YqaJ viral recombinase family nuclease [Paenibacillus sp. FSL L8-0708]|uniref:YqaJ viral recombinase family nuclease n=1 Tax=Paenibacillus sp. FSL L8-0708 TaxID=2975311 RepID=UPI0030FA6220
MSSSSLRSKRMVSTLDMTHDEWLDWRRKGIGGSDVAAICGLSRYKSPMAVYLDKLGEIPPLDDNPKMKAGRILEPVVADWFSEETGMKATKQNAIFQHPEEPHMLANIDRWLPKQNAGLECKNTAEYCRSDWEGATAPTEYILQANHYMAVTGADRWFIAVLIGGWDFQWRVVERDEELIKNLITIEREFWHSNVLAQQPPSFSHQDTEYLKETYGETTPDLSIDLPESAWEVIQKLAEARKVKAAAVMQEETAKNQIKGMMQDAEKSYFQGELRFTWKANKKGIRSFKVIGGEE